MTRAKGFKCQQPGCNGYTSVLSLRHRKDGTNIRRRECRLCGHRVTTYERIEGAFTPGPNANQPAPASASTRGADPARGRDPLRRGTPGR